MSSVLAQGLSARVSQPVDWVASGLGDVVDDEGDEQEEQCAEAGWHEDVEEGEVVYGVAADDGDEGGGATGGMDGVGEHHGGHSQGHGEARCNEVISHYLEGGDADNSGQNVTADEVPRLGQRAGDYAIDEDGGCAEGAEDEKGVSRFEEAGGQEGCEANA